MKKKLLFWTHIGAGLAGMSVGFYLSLPVVIGLVILHRIHLVVFRGCFISRIQQALGHFPRQVNFLEVVVAKFLQRGITPAQVRIFDASISIMPIFIAVIRDFTV